MSNCSCSANSQLKALAARLDRIDNDLMCHYAGISQLVTNLAMNPVVAPNVALSLKTFNYNQLGQQLLEMLLHLIPGYDMFRQLQHISASALVDAMPSALDQIAGNLISDIGNQAIDMAESRIQAEVALAQAKAEGLLGGNLQPYIDAVNTANTLLHSSPQQVQDLANAKINAELAMMVGLGKELTEQEVLKLQNAIDQADSQIGAIALAESIISKFIQTLMDIANCRTRSGVVE